LARLARKTIVYMIPFQTYARYYDLLYRDKDYVAEAEYVARTIRTAVPDACTILELGCGTGRHGRLLAGKGFQVHGIERSSEMVEMARSMAGEVCASDGGSFRCNVGDARELSLERTFDAVIALFHVVSYQTTNSDLDATFAVASNHVAPGGVFLFDVWHGPAVLEQRPEQRVKMVVDNDLEIVRTARPYLDATHNIVEVTYEFECRDRHSRESLRFSENHRVRYLFPDEIERLVLENGMQLLQSEEFVTGKPPSSATWGVAYLLRK
jgi:SAM-dependent methyltransferase